jgi:hypothetical protein
MELTIPELSPLLIISEGEVFFLKYIVPILLLLPWAMALLFFLIRLLLKYLASLKPKPKPILVRDENAMIPPNTYLEDRAPKLKEIEDLAILHPRLAIIELSQFVRIVNLRKGYERYSLEYYLRESNHKKNKESMNVLSQMNRSRLKPPDDLFAEIVQASYQPQEPTTEFALSLIQRVRTLKTKTKEK